MFSQYSQIIRLVKRMAVKAAGMVDFDVFKFNLSALEWVDLIAGM